MSVATTKFKHVSYLWDEAKAAEPGNDQVVLLVYRYNLLGADLRLTMYADYCETCKRDNNPAIRDANPVVIIYPGVGMFTFSKDKQTARVVSEFYINAINVMKGAEVVSSYTSLSTIKISES